MRVDVIFHSDVVLVEALQLWLVAFQGLQCQRAEVLRIANERVVCWLSARLSHNRRYKQSGRTVQFLVLCASDAIGNEIVAQLPTPGESW